MPVRNCEKGGKNMSVLFSPLTISRFLIEAVKAVLSALGSGIPVAVRISATDWAEGGFTPEESVMLSVRLKSLGVAFMDVSTAGIVPWAKIPAAPGFQVPFAEKIRQEVGSCVREKRGCTVSHLTVSHRKGGDHADIPRQRRREGAAPRPETSLRLSRGVGQPLALLLSGL